MTNTLTRSIQIEEVAADTRTFVGLVAPYDEVIEVGGAKERYERGVFADAALVQIYWNHDLRSQGGTPPIGEVTEFRETERGLEVVGEFYETSRGEEVYTLVKRGALNGLSANFYPSVIRNDGDVTVYEKAELLEVSVVNRPAYPSAQISEVRSDPEPNNEKEVVEQTTNNMTEVNIENDSELRSEVSDLARRFEVFESKAGTANEPVAGSKFRSFGDYVKAVAEGDPEAEAFMRAYTGGTTADSVIANGWTSDIIKVVNQGRKVWNTFSSGQWVAEGNSIEYAKLNTNTMVVSAQTAEGNDLPFGKVSITTANAPKLTRGGYTEMSLQEIKRSNVNILSVAFEAMAAEYARATEADVRNALAGAAAQTTGGAALTTADGWVDFAIDAALHLDGKGLTPEFVIVSPDRYKALAKFASANTYLLNRNSGSIDVKNLNGEVLTLPIVLIPGTGISTIGHSSAIKTFEAPGAPFQLQDENIINLTKQFSIWGEISVAVQDPKALVKVS